VIVFTTLLLKDIWFLYTPEFRRTSKSVPRSGVVVKKNNSDDV
jgi:hypothetical protein